MMNLVIMVISLTMCYSCLVTGISNFKTTGLDGSKYEEFETSNNSFVVFKNDGDPTRVIEDVNKGVWILFFDHSPDSCFVLKMTEQQRLEVETSNGKKMFSNEILENFNIKESDPVDPDIQGQCGINRKVMDLIPEEEDDSSEVEDYGRSKRACQRKIRCTIKLYRVCYKLKSECFVDGKPVPCKRHCKLFRFIHCKIVCV